MLAFVIDRKVGLGWATQKRPLAIITIVALVLAVAWFALGVILWRGRAGGSGRVWRSALVLLVAITQLLTGGTVGYFANVQREFIGDLFPVVQTPNSAPFVATVLPYH